MLTVLAIFTHSFILPFPISPYRFQEVLVLLTFRRTSLQKCCLESIEIFPLLFREKRMNLNKMRVSVLEESQNINFSIVV